MTSIVTLMDELGYPRNPDGVCKGIALMAERARRCGQYDIFKERMLYLINLKEGTLADKVAAAKQHYIDILAAKKEKNPRQNKEKKQRPPETFTPPPPANVFQKAWTGGASLAFASLTGTLSEEEKRLLDIDAFFYQIWAHFLPASIQTTLEIGGTPLNQNDTYEIEKWIYDVDSPDPRLSPLPIPEEFALFTLPRKNDAAEQTDYLKVFLQTIEADPLGSSVGLTISSYTHEVHIFYQNNVWHLTNHGSLIERPTLAEILPHLNKILRKNNVGNLYCHLYSDMPVEEQKERTTLQQKLAIISEASLQTLLKGDVNSVDSKDANPLLFAARQNDSKVVSALLKHPKIKIEEPNNRAFTQAVLHGYLVIVIHIMLHKDTLIDRDKIGKLKTILLKNPKLNINQANEDGMTLLHAAAKKNCTDLLVILLDRKDINVNQPDAHGNTMLHMAAESYENNISFLLRLRPDIEVDIPNKNRCTPLFIAAQNNNRDAVAVFLKCSSINVNAANVEGLTPLDIAAQKGHLSVVNLLLKHRDIIVKPETQLLIDALQDNQNIASTASILDAFINTPNPSPSPPTTDVKEEKVELKPNTPPTPPSHPNTPAKNDDSLSSGKHTRKLSS